MQEAAQSFWKTSLTQKIETQKLQWKLFSHCTNSHTNSDKSNCRTLLVWFSFCSQSLKSNSEVPSIPFCQLYLKCSCKDLQKTFCDILCLSRNTNSQHVFKEKWRSQSFLLLPLSIPHEHISTTEILSYIIINGKINVEEEEGSNTVNQFTEWFEYQERLTLLNLKTSPNLDHFL